MNLTWKRTLRTASSERFLAQRGGDDVAAVDNATKEKTAARKDREQLQKSLKDCQGWEPNVILPLAQQRLEIDLDDGVKVNYLKFEGAVTPIPDLAAKED